MEKLKNDHEIYILKRDEDAQQLKVSGKLRLSASK